MYGGTPPSSGSYRTVFKNLLLLWFVAVLVLGIQPRASACPVTDVDCVVDKAKDVVDDAPETVEEVEETVEEVVSDPEGSVEKIVSDTKDAVNDTVKETVQPPDAPDSDVSGVDVPEGSSPGPDTSEKVRDDRARRPNKSSGSRGQQAERAGTTRLPAGERNLVVASSETVSRVGPVAQGEPESGDLAEAARRFAFPLLLMALVAGYLFFQQRVDRRDPKLALAPMDTDMILFQ
jgi:hypothetical protein